MPPKTPEAIPVEWIGKYVDQLMDYARRLSGDSPMQQAALLRADHALDLVQAWRKSESK